MEPLKIPLIMVFLKKLLKVRDFFLGVEACAQTHVGLGPVGIEAGDVRAAAYGAGSGVCEGVARPMSSLTDSVTEGDPKSGSLISKVWMMVGGDFDVMLGRT